MKRRSFLAGAACAAAAPLSAMAQTDAGSPIPQRKLDRLGISTSTYRSNYDNWRYADPSVQPRLSHLTIPKYVRDRFGLQKLELWDQQFGPAGHTVDQCKLIRAAADAAGVAITSVEVEDLPNLGQTDPLARVEALDECKVWLDKGKILGCYGIRVNVSRGKDPVDVGIAADTLRKGAEYAHSIGMLLQVENHGGLTGRIPDMVALVKQVNDPYLKIEVDWGAWDPPGDRYADIQSAMPYVHMVSAKGEIFDETTYEHSNYDVGRIVRNAEAGGFRGVYSVELWHMPGPKDTDRAVRSFMKTIADNIA